MRFGRDLHKHRLPEWSVSYLDYYTLKKHIKLAIRSTSGQAINTRLIDTDLATSSDITSDSYDHAAAFSAILGAEISKVEEFYALQHKILQKQKESLLLCYADNASALTISGCHLDFQERVAALVACIQYSQNLRKLRWYGKVNGDALRYILRKIGRISVDLQLPKKEFLKLEFFTQVETLRELEAIDASIQNLSSACPGADQSPVRSSQFRTDLPTEVNFGVLAEALLYDDTEKLELFSSLFENDPELAQSALQQALVAQSHSCIKAILRLDVKLQDERYSTLRNVVHNVILMKSQQILLCHVDDNRRRYPNLAAQYSSRSAETLPMLGYVLEILNEKQPCAVAQKDYRSRMPLHYAAEAGLTDHCELLLKFMAPWNVLRNRSSQSLENSPFVDIEGATPFHLAVLNNHEKTLRALLASEEFLECCWGTGDKIENAMTSLLHIALSNNATGIIQAIIDTNRVNHSYRGPRNETTLFVASRVGSSEHVELLNRAKPFTCTHLNAAESSYGWTPLIVACVHGQLDLTKQLLEMGVDQKLTDAFGWTALDHAAFRGHWSLLGLLDPSSRGLTTRLPKTPLSVTNALPPCPPSTTRIFVNLGALNTRKPRTSVDVSTYLLQRPYSRYPEVGLSVVVEGLGMDGPGCELNLPVLDDMVNSPLIFETTNAETAKIVLKVFRQTSKMPNQRIQIGTAVALLDELGSTMGPGRESFFRDHVLPIVGTEASGFIGTLVVNFLVAKPFPDPRVFSDSTPKKETWRFHEKTGLIGHRGLGMNSPAFKRLQIGENTIQSFRSTIDLGVSYIECADVQLTSDHVPIIYHDFIISESGADIAPHNLSFDQFMCISDMQQPTLYQKSSNKIDSETHVPCSSTLQRRQTFTTYSGDNCRERDLLTRIKQTHEFKVRGFKGNVRGAYIHDSFMTLEELLTNLPEDVAIDIELKYPMLWEAEDWKMDLYGVEFNLYIDTILDKIYKHAGERSILLTSFSPELCILAAHKQNTYPIMFLNESNLFPTGDVRASNLQEAIHFARHWALAGVVMSSEPFIASPKLVEFVHDANLTCLSFGMLNNDVENAKIQVKAGVDALIVDSVALIYDRI